MRRELLIVGAMRSLEGVCSVASRWDGLSGMGGARDGWIEGREGEFGGTKEVESCLRRGLRRLVRGCKRR